MAEDTLENAPEKNTEARRAHYPILEGTLDGALFDGRVQGVITPFYENERPMLGLAGTFDWRFEGAGSQALRAGAIIGRAGECVYLPVERAGRLYHWILIGGGFLATHGRRGLLPDEAFAALKKNLTKLGLSSVGASRKDLGGLNDDYLHRALGKVPLWMAP